MLVIRVTIKEVRVILHVPISLFLCFLHEEQDLLAGGHPLDPAGTIHSTLVLVDVILNSEHSHFIFILFMGRMDPILSFK